MSRASRMCIVVGVCAGVCASVVAVPARGQETLLPATGWGSGAVLSAWHFSAALPQAGGAVADVAEIAIPFRVRTSFGSWSMDLTGAGAFGGVHLTAGASSQDQNGSGNGGGDNGDKLVSIFGPTDVKLRLSGPIVGDAWQMTAGLNIPTGKVGLDGDEITALQAVGAPALRMPVASFGSGSGATLGVIRAFQGDDWALALGASAEQRTEYSAIALALASGAAETKVTPGTAAHVTLGLDRALGDNRMNVLLVGDVFSTDKVRSTAVGAPDALTQYQLGPQLTATTRIDFASTSWREAALGIGARFRSEFSDSSGAKVSGSSGSYLEASLGGVRGGPTGAGFLIGTDVRWHSGLKFTDALVGAAVTAVGVTMGVERAGDVMVSRFYVHGQYGTFDTGTANTTGMGLTIGFTLARREAR